MKQYLDSLRYVMENGEDVNDRTGTGTRAVFGYQMRFNLQHGFPAVTTKKLAWKGVVSELLWFLEGSDDERRLAEIRYEKSRDELIGKRTIWTDNADNQGKDLGYQNDEHFKKLGPVYGVQWRNWKSYSTGLIPKVTDQIENIIHKIKTNPDDRRIILSAWNVGEIDQMALPPCHCFAQFRVINGKLSCQLYQRSCDMFLGVPFNIASYALLTHMLAQICGLEVGEFVWTGGDVHIYKNHFDQVQEQIQRAPRVMPNLVMPEFSTLDELLATKTSDYKLDMYDPMPSIEAEMAI